MGQRIGQRKVKTPWKDESLLLKKEIYDQIVHKRNVQGNSNGREGFYNITEARKKVERVNERRSRKYLNCTLSREQSMCNYLRYVEHTPYRVEQNP